MLRRLRRVSMQAEQEIAMMQESGFLGVVIGLGVGGHGQPASEGEARDNDDTCDFEELASGQ